MIRELKDREVNGLDEDTNLMNEVSLPKSIRHSDLLASYLISNGKISTQDYTCDTPEINIFGLLIDIISPDTKSLQLMRKKYANSAVVLEIIEGSNVSEAKAAED